LKPAPSISGDESLIDIVNLANVEWRNYEAARPWLIKLIFLERLPPPQRRRAERGDIAKTKEYLKKAEQFAVGKEGGKTFGRQAESSDTNGMSCEAKAPKTFPAFSQMHVLALLLIFLKQYIESDDCPSFRRTDRSPDSAMEEIERVRQS
jgi:hypothetical protein